MQNYKNNLTHTKIAIKYIQFSLQIENILLLLHLITDQGEDALPVRWHTLITRRCLTLWLIRP